MDVEATRKLKAEKTAAASAAAGAASPPRVGGGKGKSPATLKWRERWPQSHGTAAAAARASSNATASSLVGGRADGDGSAGRGTGNGDGRGGGDEDGDVVFRWHVDSLLSGGENMEVVPLMEEGFGECFGCGSSRKAAGFVLPRARGLLQNVERRRLIG